MSQPYIINQVLVQIDTQSPEQVIEYHNMPPSGAAVQEDPSIIVQGAPFNEHLRLAFRLHAYVFGIPAEWKRV